MDESTLGDSYDMIDYRSIEQSLASSLGLERRPVAVATREEPPAGVAAFEGTAPSGCTFWRLAAGGRSFYTVPADHYNCPVGSYTHNIALPPDREGELAQVIGLMTGAGYIRIEEVPAIPRLPQTPPVVVYAPLGDTPVAPDVVIFPLRAASLMLLAEAANRAGAAPQLPLLGRPTCAAIPAAMSHGFVASTGCIGNRIYTDIGDNEMYAAVPGSLLERLAAEAAVTAGANRELAIWHRGRRETLASA
jgi:uncharacterized protein (DUF169 family)